MRKANLPPPVAQLFRLHKPKRGTDWPDYLSMGLGAEHIPDLIRIALDSDLNLAPTRNPKTWIPVHAWRALGQLHAAAAAEPLTKLLFLIDDNDDLWVAEELPKVFAFIGPPAIPALTAYLADSDHPTQARQAAASGLRMISRKHRDTREECIRVFTAQLERFADNDPFLNAELVQYLTALKAVVSAPVIEKAYAAGRVHEFVAGDWEDAQVRLGLKAKRDTRREPVDIIEIMSRILKKRLGDAAPILEPPAAQRPQTEPGTSPRQPPADQGQTQSAPLIYQLHIALRFSSPPIWRRVLVSGDMTLSSLHDVIQILMDWDDEHLHGFTPPLRGRPEDLHRPGLEEADEPETRISDVLLRKGEKMLYEYDFGDSWRHDITVEAITANDPRYPGHPVCLKAARAAPLEDSGGLGGYEHALEVAQNPNHDDHEWASELVGEHFDPDTFDIELHNRLLKRLK